jgi:hypothetical protein
MGSKERLHGMVESRIGVVGLFYSSIGYDPEHKGMGLALVSA